jgi:hypothetical protein
VRGIEAVLITQVLERLHSLQQRHKVTVFEHLFPIGAEVDVLEERAYAKMNIRMAAIRVDDQCPEERACRFERAS